MMKQTSLILSAAFYPMQSLFYAFFLAAYLLPPLQHPFRHYAFFALITSMYVLFPVLLILLLKQVRVIKSLSLCTRKDRRLILLGTAIFYAIHTYFLYRYFPLHPYILTGLFASAALALLLSFCNLWLKISIHAAGMGAWMGYWLFLFHAFPQYDLLFPFMACTFLTGAVLSARLYLQAHTPREIYLGIALGFAALYIIPSVPL